MKKAKILKYQHVVLKELSGKIGNFYLAGGTALSLFYFQHRLSVDLDFFTPHFNQKEIKQIVEFLRKRLKAKTKFVGQSLKKEIVKIMSYNIFFTETEALKIDFVEDVNKLIKKPKVVDGVNILSLEDIYIRKIFALIGYIEKSDKAGRLKLAGGRSDAKDFYDIYCLSHIFMPLSRFVGKYCNTVLVEGLIGWFQTFDRMKIMDGALELITDKKIDYRDIERHFKREIDKIAEQQIGEI